MLRTRSDYKHLLLGFVLAVCLAAMVGWKAEIHKSDQQMAAQGTPGWGFGYAAAAVSVACSHDGKTVYAADIRGVYRSTDLGQTWQDITPKE